MSSEAQVVENQWYYEDGGERKGPISESDIIELIKLKKIFHGSSVWKKSYPDWQKVENTELKTYLHELEPPPLTGEHVNNTVVWVLAFAPLIGLFLEYFFAGLVNSSNQFQAEMDMANNKYWFISLALNIGLSLMDEKRLKKAGNNTEKFKGWVWLVPVYLFQRAKNMKHNYAYFGVWVACFVLTLFL